MYHYSYRNRKFSFYPSSSSFKLFIFLFCHYLLPFSAYIIFKFSTSQSEVCRESYAFSTSYEEEKIQGPKARLLARKELIVSLASFTELESPRALMQLDRIVSMLLDDQEADFNPVLFVLAGYLRLVEPKQVDYDALVKEWHNLAYPFISELIEGCDSLDAGLKHALKNKKEIGDLITAQIKRINRGTELLDINALQQTLSKLSDDVKRQSSKDTSDAIEKFGLTTLLLIIASVLRPDPKSESFQSFLNSCLPEALQKSFEDTAFQEPLQEMQFYSAGALNDREVAVLQRMEERITGLEKKIFESAVASKYSLAVADELNKEILNVEHEKEQAIQQSKELLAKMSKLTAELDDERRNRKPATVEIESYERRIAQLENELAQYLALEEKNAVEDQVIGSGARVFFAARKSGAPTFEGGLYTKRKLGQNNRQAKISISDDSLTNLVQESDQLPSNPSLTNLEQETERSPSKSSSTNLEQETDELPSIASSTNLEQETVQLSSTPEFSENEVNVLKAYLEEKDEAFSTMQQFSDSRMRPVYRPSTVYSSNQQIIWEYELLSMCLRTSVPSKSKRFTTSGRRGEAVRRLFRVMFNSNQIQKNLISDQRQRKVINTLCETLGKTQANHQDDQGYSLDGKWIVVYDDQGFSRYSRFLRDESRAQIFADNGASLTETTVFKLKGTPFKIPIVKEALFGIEDGTEQSYCGFGPFRGLPQTQKLIYLGKNLRIVQHPITQKYTILMKV